MTELVPSSTGGAACSASRAEWTLRPTARGRRSSSGCSSRSQRGHWSPPRELLLVPRRRVGLPRHAERRQISAICCDPHNEHMSVLPILAYRALWHLFGLRSYVPVPALVIALHLTAAVLLRVVMRRVRRATRGSRRRRRRCSCCSARAKRTSSGRSRSASPARSPSGSPSWCSPTTRPDRPTRLDRARLRRAGSAVLRAVAAHTAVVGRRRAGAAGVAACAASRPCRSASRTRRGGWRSGPTDQDPYGRATDWGEILHFVKTAVVATFEDIAAAARSSLRCTGSCSSPVSRSLGSRRPGSAPARRRDAAVVAARRPGVPRRQRLRAMVDRRGRRLEPVRAPRGGILVAALAVAVDALARLWRPAIADRAGSCSSRRSPTESGSSTATIRSAAATSTAVGTSSRRWCNRTTPPKCLDRPVPTRYGVRSRRVGSWTARNAGRLPRPRASAGAKRGVE